MNREAKPVANLAVVALDEQTEHSEVGEAIRVKDACAL